MMTCPRCGMVVDSHTSPTHLCNPWQNAPGGLSSQPFLATQPILTEADVRRIVREELDARKESK